MHKQGIVSPIAHFFGLKFVKNQKFQTDFPRNRKLSQYF